jgi:hypothetical protein
MARKKQKQQPVSVNAVKETGIKSLLPNMLMYLLVIVWGYIVITGSGLRRGHSVEL